MLVVMILLSTISYCADVICNEQLNKVVAGKYWQSANGSDQHSLHFSAGFAAALDCGHWNVYITYLIPALQCSWITFPAKFCHFSHTRLFHWSPIVGNEVSPITGRSTICSYALLITLFMVTITKCTPPPPIMEALGRHMTGHNVPFKLSPNFQASFWMTSSDQTKDIRRADSPRTYWNCLSMNLEMPTQWWRGTRFNIKPDF